MYINNNDRKRDLEVAKGAFALSLSVILVKIIGLIYKVPLSHILGDDGMGYFNSAYTVFTFFYMLCSGGVPRAVSILVTEMRVRGEDSKIPRMLLISLCVFGSLGALLTMLFIVFSGYISELIGNSLSALSLIAIAPSLTFVAASGVLRGYLVGYKKMGSVALAEVLEASVKFAVGMAFALFAARRNFGAPMISAYTVIGVTSGAFIGSLVLFVSANITKRENKAGQKENGVLKIGEVVVGIIRISLPITLSSAIMGIANIADLGLVMRRLESLGIDEASAVAAYGNFSTLVVPMLNLGTAIVAPIMTSALPHLAADHASKRYDDFKTFTARIISACGVVTVPIAVGFYAFPYEVLSLIFKDDSARIAAPLLVLIAPSVVLMPLLTLVHTALEASLHQRMPIISMLLLSASKITLSFVLIGKIGIGGAPIGTTVSYAVAFLSSVLILYLKCGVSPLAFLSLSRPTAAAFFAIGIARKAYIGLSPSSGSHSVFLLSVAISLALYALFMIILSLKPKKILPFFVKFTKNSKA